MREQTAYRPIPARTSAPPTAAPRIPANPRVLPTETEDEIYPARPPSSAIRWTTKDGDQVFQQGNRRVIIHKEAPPKHGVFFWCIMMGLFLFIMVIGWIIFTAAGYWWQGKQEDWKYGVPRTYQVDQFVSHGDSPDHPDHFIAVNAGGVIQVVELNPLQPKYDHVYPITTVNDATTPVVIGFEDANHDGKLDMLVTVGDSNSYTVILLNDGQQFKH